MTGDPLADGDLAGAGDRHLAVRADADRVHVARVAAQHRLAGASGHRPQAQRPVEVTIVADAGDRPQLRAGLSVVVEIDTGITRSLPELIKTALAKVGTDPSVPLSTTVNYDGLMGDVAVGNTLVVDNGAMLMRIDVVEADRGFIVLADRSGTF